MRASEGVRRGVTLIELMVSVAVLSIVMTAVLSVVVSISRQRQEATNLVEVRSNARVALSMMQFDAANAGVRFGAAPFAVRVLQNVTGAEPELADTVDCGGRAGWTVMPETDVIEFREGANELPSGTVPFGCPASGCFAGSTFFTAAPFANLGDGTNTVVFFSNAATACAARLTGTIADAQSSPTFSTMLTQSLRTAAPAMAYPAAGPGQCPAQGMSINALRQVTRYLVCRPPVFDANSRPALFRQRWGPTYPMAGSLINYVSVQEAVEDLQVASLVSLSTNAGTITGITGSSCSGTGVNAICWCGQVAGDCMGFIPDPTVSGVLNGASTDAAQRSPFLVRSYRVAVTTLSSRSRGMNDQGVFSRPALFDHAAGAITDYGAAGSVGASVYSNSHRTVMESTIMPQNISLVTP
ncbi:MAG: type II secretion system protein [Myxococcales bacterium]|nr:type II secretion system protein [Myxococcales bacterium]